jgi:ABC-2 type transport system ATP-binding protein
MNLLDPALRLQRLTKTFGATRAVDELDLVVPRGSTYGFIGPSGAGKTTCIRMIMSILFPDSGVLSVLGHRSALEAKDRIGYLPEERGVYRRMRVGDFLVYIAQLKGVSADEALPRARELLARTGLVDVEKKRCEEMSKGMLHRVEFVAAIINKPELIILDEPFSGLDPVSVKRLKELVVSEQQRGATILFSTHIMAHAEELCQHVVMIHRGRKVLDEPMAGLRRQYDPRVIQVEPLDENTSLHMLRELPGVADVRPTADGCEVQLLPDVEPTAVMQQISATIRVARIALARLRLEDVFLRLVASDTDTPDTERALRANLQGIAAEGAVL